MIATIKEDATVLVPNKEHKNFTETSEIITKNTSVEGEFKSISGLRRGEPFSYRVFITKDGQIIYSNKVNEEMNTTEVSLGADAQRSATMVDMKPAETFKSSRVVVSLAAGLGAFVYAKKKGKNPKQSIKYAVIGALLGYATMWAVDKTRNVTVSQSK
jgi:hypothetical protein